MTRTEITDVRVRATLGTYTTATVRGLRANCTAGDKQAAEALGRKLYGASLVRVTHRYNRIPVQGITEFQLHAETVCAWAWRSGLIEFGKQVPDGALSFATGMDRPLRAIVGVLAREGKGKNAGKLLVPGVPEAGFGHAKVDALIAWVIRCAKGNGKKESDGVVFTNRPDGRP